LVKNEEGGWILGGKIPTTGATADQPVQLDSDDEDDRIKKEIKAKVVGSKSNPKEEEEGEDDWESDDDDDDLEMVEVKTYIPPAQPTATLRPLAPKSRPSLEDANSLVNHPEAYVDEDESIEKVMAKFAEIEDVAARKRSVALGLEGSEVLPMEIDELDSFGPHNSLDTIYSDATLDGMDDFEDLMEDEETGEIVSRKAYERKELLRARNQSGIHTEEDGDQRRALLEEEESQLEEEAFYSYWVGYTPESFKDKHADFEFMIRAAITEWEDKQLSDELHSAKRKLEKSNVNDIKGVETLLFWASFLESVSARRRFTQSLVADTTLPPAAVSAESTNTPVGKQQPSQILRQDLLGDEYVEGAEAGRRSEDDEDDFVLTRAPVRPELAPTLPTSQAVIPSTGGVIEETVSGPRGAIVMDSRSDDLVSLRLDFSSSILKQRQNIAVSSTQADILKTPHYAPQPSTEVEVAIDDQATEPTVSTGITSSVASPRHDSMTLSVDRDGLELQIDTDLSVNQQGNGKPPCLYCRYFMLSICIVTLGY
jgi:hypothetical protein